MTPPYVLAFCDGGYTANLPAKDVTGGHGEVSPYLAGDPRAGDQLELRGPIGRWFVWDTSDGGPLLLVAGGSGAGPVAETVVYLRGPTSAA